MHITLETDYAIRIVTYLLQIKRRADAQEISENTDVTLRFSLKILRKLAASELVRSYKGASGGYEAAKAPNEISLADVLNVIEGETFCISRCLHEGSGGCLRGGASCKANHIFAEISDYVQEKLSKATFDQLL